MKHLPRLRLPRDPHRGGDFAARHRPAHPDQVQDLRVTNQHPVGPAGGADFLPVRRAAHVGQGVQPGRGELLARFSADALPVAGMRATVRRQPQPIGAPFANEPAVITQLGGDLGI